MAPTKVSIATRKIACRALQPRALANIQAPRRHQDGGEAQYVGESHQASFHTIRPLLKRRVERYDEKAAGEAKQDQIENGIERQLERRYDATSSGVGK